MSAESPFGQKENQISNKFEDPLFKLLESLKNDSEINDSTQEDDGDDDGNYNSQTDWYIPDTALKNGLEDLSQLKEFITNPAFLEIWERFPATNGMLLPSKHYDSGVLDKEGENSEMNMEMVPFYFSNVLKLNTSDENHPINGRLFAILYSFNKSGGELEPYIYYKSESDGKWKASVPTLRYFMNDGGVFSKGNHYTKSGKPIRAISNHLESIEQFSGTTEFAFTEDLLAFLSEKIQRQHLTWKGEITDGLGDREVNPIDKTDSIYSVVKNGAFIQHLMKAEVSQVEVPDHLIPDFSNAEAVIGMESLHPTLGKYKNIGFSHAIDGKYYTYRFAQPVDGSLPWIDGIEQDSGTYDFEDIHPAGVYHYVDDFGPLDLKPLEYEHQIPISLKTSLPKVKGYVDLRPFLSQTKIMKKYSEWVEKERQKNSDFLK